MKSELPDPRRPPISGIRRAKWWLLVALIILLLGYLWISPSYLPNTAIAGKKKNSVSTTVGDMHQEAGRNDGDRNRAAFKRQFITEFPRSLARPAEGNTSASDANLIDVCGYGKRNPFDIETQTLDANGPETISAASSIADILSKSATEKERAMGLYLRAKADAWDGYGISLDEYSRCVNDVVCVSNYQKKVFAAQDVAAEPLARLAMTTQDPDVYAAAFQLCFFSQTGACKSITADRWSRVDPQNAVPWLFVGGEAGARGDIIRRNAAFARASTLTSYNYRLLPLNNVLNTEIATALKPLQQVALAEALMNLQNLSVWYPPFIQVEKYCEVASSKAPERLSVCDSLAAKLATESSHEVDVIVAARIGRNSGWMPERINKLVGESNARSELIAALKTPDNKQSCESAEVRFTYALNVMEFGDARVAKKIMADEGLSAQKTHETYTKRFP